MNDLEIYEFFKESGIYEEESIYEDPEKFFGIDYMKESSDVLLEAKGATKSNVFQKLWNVIRKAFSSIAKIFNKFIQWIKGLLFGRKKAKTADQIAIDSGLSFTDEFSDFLDDDISSPSYYKQTNTDSASSNKKTVYKIEIPASKDSELTLPPIEVAFKNLLVKYDSDKKSIIFNLQEIKKRSIDDYNNSSAASKHGKVIGQASIGYNYLYAFRLIHEPEKMDKFVNVVKDLCEYAKGNNQIDIMKMEKIFKEVDIASGMTTDYNEIDVKYEEFERFSKQVMQINKMMSDVNLTTDGVQQTKEHSIYGDIIGKTYDDKLINLINNIASVAFRLQMGINAITATIQQAFIVDKRFANCCDTLEKLDKFTYDCIMAGFPPKFIAYNIWIIMTKNLKGDAKQNQPVWGQSRVVFFPLADKNSVYKVGLSTNGIFANKTERNITLKALNGDTTLGTENPADLLNYLAKATALTTNGTVVTMERAIDDIRPTNLEISQLTKKVQGICNGVINNANFKINDLHNGNARKMADGHLKFIDYGMASLTRPNYNI